MGNVAQGRSVADVIAERFKDAGVDTFFGVVGSTNFGITRALADQGARFIAARHETNAVVMAESWALQTGQVGVASVHAGPGLTNAGTAIAEAAKTRTPLVVFTGDAITGAVDSNFTMDQRGFAESLGAVYERLHSSATAPADAARALDRALVEKTAVVLGMPVDLQTVELPEVSRDEKPQVGREPRPIEPNPADIEQLGDLIEAAERPVFLAGWGAVRADAGDDIAAVAAQVGGLLATTARAHGLFSGDAWSLGLMGGFGSPAVTDLVPEADLIIGFGASFTRWTTRQGSLLKGTKAVVQIDDHATRLGNNRPVELGIVADAGRVAVRLHEELTRRGITREGWRTSVTAERLKQGANNTHDYEEHSTETTVDPRTVTKELDQFLPSERTVITDGGHFSGWPTRHLEVPDAQGWLFKQSFQSIGLGLAASIGAALARPDRLTVAALGDGGAMMSIADLETAVRTTDRMLILVYNDSAYGAEVHHFAPMGVNCDIVTFPLVDFAAVAKGHGAQGAVVTDLEDLQPVRSWVESGAPGVFVVDIRVGTDLVADWLHEALSTDS